MKQLGEVHGRTGCIAIPEQLSLTVREADSTGAIIDSATFSWTPDHPAGVFLTATSLDRQGLGRTRTFVPDSTTGWQLSFKRQPDDGLPFTAVLNASERCRLP